MRAHVWLVVLLAGCAAPAPKKHWEWWNQELVDQGKAGQIGIDEAKKRASLDFNTCKIESLKIPIPSPACTTPAYQDCSQVGGGVFGGMAQGMCRNQQQQPVCDYSSVNDAREARGETFDACMATKGWQKKWFASQ